MKNIVLATLSLICCSAFAQDKADAWYPRTESLAPDEMFVVALGTGMPTPITRAQKSTAWYVELGNGDIFLFDVGSGSMESLFALRPDFQQVDKVFASHLHTDHVGDAAALWVGGWLSGRLHRYTSMGPAAPMLNLVPPLSWTVSKKLTRGISLAAQASFLMTAAS